MDLYVKLQGLKHNFRIVHGVFAKFRGSGELPELLNYFSIEKSVNRVYGTVDRVHGTVKP
jgi:hypothetical protein